MRIGRIFSSQTKMTSVQSGDVDRSTDSLETEAVERLAQPSGKESSLHVPVFCLLVHSWWKSACFVFRCLASNGSLPHRSVMFRSFFHGDFRLFWNTFCWQWGHKFSGTEWHTSLRNRSVRRRICKISGFPLYYPFNKWLLWDSSKVYSILKYTKRLMFEMWHSMQVFCYSSKESRPIDVLCKFWIYCVDVF